MHILKIDAVGNAFSLNCSQSPCPQYGTGCWNDVQCYSNGQTQWESKK